MLRITMTSPRAQDADGTGGCTIAVIGGGFTGTMIAKLLTERGYHHVDEVVIFEPRDCLGCGLAYDTQDPALRLNVSAHRMRAVPGKPSAFIEWLQKSGTLSVDPAALTGGDIYARRKDFGAFMRQQIEPHLQNGNVRHVRERVTRVARRHGQWKITGSGGTIVRADVTIVAIGHPPAGIPKIIAQSYSAHSRIIMDAQSLDALQKVGPDDRVLVVGAGLTALDVLASLTSRQHRGHVTLLSRTGLLPRPHATGDFSPHGDFQQGKVKTARALLRSVRAAVREAEESGRPWQSVFDALRQQAQGLWQELHVSERRKLVRRLRRWYESHRFRMPPQISDVLQRELRSGRVETMAGHLTSVTAAGKGIEVEINSRGSKPERLTYDWIVLATGPDQGNLLDHQPWLRLLEGDGLIRRDPLDLGIACDRQSRAIGADGHSAPTLYIAGPPARGTFGELTGVPEIATQAAAIVDTILQMQTSPTRTITIRS